MVTMKNLKVVDFRIDREVLFLDEGNKEI